MLLIGDVHGKFKEYKNIISQEKDSIQLGDFGIGFSKHAPEIFEGQHWFIRGNHDNPKLCEKHNNFLGDYGYYNSIFFVGGAFSIDYQWRQQYEILYNKKIWWEDEQISKTHYPNIKKMYRLYKPKIVISHEAPHNIAQHIIGGNAKDKLKYSNDTRNILLPELFKIHHPKLWVFGHYHKSFKKELEGTLFICLKELETLRLHRLGEEYVLDNQE